jgi:hypothetical protein
MGWNFSGLGVRSGVTGVALDDVTVSQDGGDTAPGHPDDPLRFFAKFLLLPDTPGERRLRCRRAQSRLDVFMGRKSKGERRQIMTRVPPLAGARIKREVEALGCHYSDLIAYTLCQHTGVPMDIPMGEVVQHPDLREAPGHRVEFTSRVPSAAADVVTDEAERMGVSIADYVGKVLCDRFDIPFEPRVKKKALRAWAKAAEAGEQLPMTG